MISKTPHLMQRSVLLVAVAIFGAVVGGCSRTAAPEKREAQGHGGTAVTVAPAIRRDISKSVEVTGSLVALNDVVVGARMAGKVTAVLMREGDPVTVGQIVATMDMVDYQAQVESARANLDAAVARQHQANILAEQARNQVSQAEMNLDVTDKSTAAALAVARAALTSAEQTLSVVRQGARQQEREQAQQQVRAAKANLDKLSADLKRMKELYQDQAISASQLDQVQASYDAAEASYRTALEALSLVQEGARKEDIRKAELAVEQAQEGLKKAEADRRLVDLRKADVANARAALRSAQAGVATAEQSVRQARAALDIAKNALNNAYVRAPVNGYVAARLAEPGQQLGAGGPIVRIVAPGSVYFQATVSESEYADLAVGQPVEVTVDALPNRKYAGRVTRIFPVASSAARSFTVRVDFQGDSRLRPQMFARGMINVGTHRNATLVNKDAVIFGGTDSEATVFVVDANNRAEERKVRVGFSNPEFVEILSGVKPGDRVVVAGQNVLRNGDTVTVR